MNDTAITRIEGKLFAIPLPDVLSDAMHGDITHFQLITATITQADGRQGTGYTYTVGKGGHGILATIRHDLAPALIGKDASEVEHLYDFMDLHLHYVGRGGMANFRHFRASTSRCGTCAPRRSASRCGSSPAAPAGRPAHIAAASISTTRSNACSPMSGVISRAASMASRSRSVAAISRKTSNASARCAS